MVVVVAGGLLPHITRIPLGFFTAETTQLFPQFLLSVTGSGACTMLTMIISTTFLRRRIYYRGNNVEIVMKRLVFLRGFTLNFIVSGRVKQYTAREGGWLVVFIGSSAFRLLLLLRQEGGRIYKERAAAFYES